MNVCEVMALAGDALNATLSRVFGMTVSFLNLVCPYKSGFC